MAPPALRRSPRRSPRRGVAAGALALVLVAGLVIHFAAADSPASDIAGDVLYATAVYAGLCVLAPRLPPIVLAACAASWGVAVELFQLTGVPLALAAAFPPAMLVLGTVFDPRDLLIALAVPVVAGVLDVLVSARVRHSSTDSVSRDRGGGPRR